MAHGFLGTPASIMLDVVVCSLVLILPTLLYSLFTVKVQRNYRLHKTIQTTLSLVLFVVVALFEVDLRRSGGFYELAKNSPYIETAFLKNLLTVHLIFSISTCFVWGGTFIVALKKFPNPPGPSAFSPKHKFWAWLSVADMVGTVVTGLMVYYYGFVAR